MMESKALIKLYLAFILSLFVACENETIHVPTSGIEISLSSEIIEVGSSDTVETIIYPENSNSAELLWTSSDPSIAEVNRDGIVTGISPGVSVITVSTRDNKLFARDTVHVIRWTYYNMSNVPVRPIAIDSENIVWCGGIEITRIMDNQLTVYPHVQGISAITIDDSDNKWFGTYNSGVWKYDGSNWTNFNVSNSNLTYSSIGYNSMAHDQTGNVWFGTIDQTTGIGIGTGVTRYDGGQWTVFNSDRGLVNNAVHNIAIDNEGKKWFATNAGISSFDDSSWMSYTVENTGIKLIQGVFSIAVDNDNNKWFGSYGGALKFDGENWTEYPLSKDKTKEWSAINAIAVDNSDNKWFATEYGVAKFDGKKWINYPSPNGRVHNVRSISIDSDGNKWLGTSFGVIKLED